MNILRQSTAVDDLIGPFVDSTDGDSEEVGLTIEDSDVKLSKNGQPVVDKADVTNAAHDADGFYNCELDATDTNTVGNLVLYVHVRAAGRFGGAFGGRWGVLHCRATGGLDPTRPRHRARRTPRRLAACGTDAGALD